MRLDRPACVVQPLAVPEVTQPEDLQRARRERGGACCREVVASRPGAPGRAHGVDGRPLNLWRVNLSEASNFRPSPSRTRASRQLGHEREFLKRGQAASTCCSPAAPRATPRVVLAIIATWRTVGPTWSLERFGTHREIFELPLDQLTPAVLKKSSTPPRADHHAVARSSSCVSLIAHVAHPYLSALVTRQLPLSAVSAATSSTGTLKMIVSPTGTPCSDRVSALSTRPPASVRHSTVTRLN